MNNQQLEIYYAKILHRCAVSREMIAQVLWFGQM